MYCPQCGANLVEKSNYCHNCGAKHESQNKEPEKKDEPKQGADYSVLCAIMVFIILVLYYLYHFDLIR